MTRGLRGLTLPQRFRASSLLRLPHAQTPMLPMLVEQVGAGSMRIAMQGWCCAPGYAGRGAIFQRVLIQCVVEKCLSCWQCECAIVNVRLLL